MRTYRLLLPLTLLPVACGSGSETDTFPRDAGSDLGLDVYAETTPADVVDAAVEPLPDAHDSASESGGDAPTDAGEDGQEDAAADVLLDAGPPPGCIQGDFQRFFGNLHAHTSYSDGAQLPQDAFAHARDVAGLDVMVVTDHLEQLYWPSPLGRWGKCGEQADAADAPGAFLALCGFEYGSGFQGITSTGHNNVFFSDQLFPAVQLDFHDFYQTLAGCTGCVGQFNHPGDESGQTWLDFEFHPEVDARIQLFEFNGGGDVWNLYFAALDKGWHVSPVMNQDNHSADWGSKDDTRSGLWMSDLTRAGLRDTLANRRTFMTRDRNATIRLMADGVCWMGSVLTGVSSVEVVVEVADGDAGEGYSTIELFGPGKQVLGTKDCQGAEACTLAQGVSGVAYVLARATQVDGDELVSAPVWVGP